MRTPDNKHPFYRPLWIRIAIVVACASWSGLEWWNGQDFWGMLTLFATAYAVWALFIAYDPKETDQAGKSETAGE